MTVVYEPVPQVGPNISIFLPSGEIAKSWFVF